MSKKIAGGLYKAARTMNDIETIASGNPVKIVRRAKNKLIGRLLAKVNYPTLKDGDSLGNELKIWR